MDASGKPTIYDVAKIAGVSANTVSRVLNGKEGVGAATKSRILQIMRDVDYHPHVGARAMRGRRAGCIGLTLTAPLDVVPVSQPMFSWLFEELYRLFGSTGDRVCFDLNPFVQSSNGDYARSIWDNLYSVCVLAGPLAVDDTVVERIHRTGIPYLALGRLDRFPECSSATVDYEHGAYLSTKFLLDRGHKRIAMLKALSGFQPGVERRRGYIRALEEAGIEPDDQLIRSVTFGASSIVSVVHRLLNDSDVTAFVDCSATEDASGIREGARRAGRVPGQDFEIVVWTYTNDAVVLPEACAHVWLPVLESASEGLELLADWHHGKREDPIQLAYAPTMYESPTGHEISAPRRVFDSLR
jgi:DNA-binding LacI/PurR family transcriptional regulator